jgi:hypothetical protein
MAEGGNDQRAAAARKADRLATTAQGSQKAQKNRTSRLVQQVDVLIL